MTAAQKKHKAAAAGSIAAAGKAAGSVAGKAAAAGKKDNAKALFATMALVAAVGAAIGFGAPLISAIMTQRHFSAAVIGYNATMGGFATVIAAMLTPRIALRFGVVPSILTMLALGALSFLGFYCFESLPAWFMLRFSLHFAMTVMFILSEFWVNSAASPARRAFILALYSAAMGAGVTIGPALFSFVGSAGLLPFAIGGLLVVLACFPVLAARKLAPRFVDAEHQPFLRHIFKRPESTLAAFVFGAVQLGAVSLITPFGLRAGYSEAQAGQFLTVLALGNAVLLMPISYLSDHTGRRSLILWLCALIGLAGALCVPLLLAHSLWLKLDLFLVGGVSAGLYTLGLAGLGVSLRGHELAAANSAFIFCYGIGILAGPALSGFAMDRCPQIGFPAVMAAFFGVYVVFVGLLRLKKLFCG